MYRQPDNQHSQEDDEYYAHQNSYYFNEGMDSTGQEANTL